MSPVVELVRVLALMPVTGYALIGAWRAAHWIGEVRARRTGAARGAARPAGRGPAPAAR